MALVFLALIIVDVGQILISVITVGRVLEFILVIHIQEVGVQT